MDHPDLTIGIATYNGQVFLSAVLDTLIGLVTDKNVEIIVSDNASVDGTASIAKDFQSRYPETIRYVRNEKNIGFDANVDNVVRQAKAPFVWLMADDDFLLPGSVDRVLDVIRNNPELSLIFVNFSNRIKLGLSEDALCLDGNEFFSKNRFKNGLISSNIVNRQLWLDLDMKRFDGCLWVHFAYSVQAMAPKEARRGYIIATELIRQDGIGRWGGGGSFIFTGLKLVQLFSDMEALGYTRRLKKEADFIVKKGYPENIPRAKAQGLKVGLDLIRQMRRLYGKYPTFWLIDLPMLIVPNRIYSVAFKVVRSIRQKNREPA
jgi:abequosyltransferase